MKLPLSWLRDFVDIELSIEELAHRLTLAGLEVEEIRYVGLPLSERGLEGRSGGHQRHETKISGLPWDPAAIVVGEVREVMAHPDADRLVLCRLFDGEREHTVLTGAPNLFPYAGKGELEPPLKVPYAREGAEIYDGHQPGWEVAKLERRKIRGVESYSMICSEKELGISEAHEGIIVLDADAPTGQPLVDYMGDAVLDIAITPNIARNANVLGVAREVAALTGVELRPPSYEVDWQGPSIEGRAALEIREPELNPRFVLGLIEGVEIKPSPYWVQRRLRLAGMRPINNIVDSTNYVMLEIGEPLHAFDYDVLVERAGGAAPTILTRRAEPGEKLTTLDEVERSLDDFTVLVCDAAGSLSIAGVMGGAESEVGKATRNVLLEGAAWNFINIRQTLAAQRVPSEAAYRFSRGVHPAMAERGVRRGLELMRRLSGGVVAEGLVDAYPLPPEAPVVEISPADTRRWLGIDLGAQEMADLLSRLEFEVEVKDESLRVTPPDHRLDIGSGVEGMADLMEEIARIYGYDRIPETLMSDELAPPHTDRAYELEERLRDLLVGLGYQEVVTYRLTEPERDARWLPASAPPDDRPYVRLRNPISSERVVLRHSLMASVLETLERNARVRERLTVFEIGPIYLPGEEELPEEQARLVLALTGPRQTRSWQQADTSAMDFYDLKGSVESLLEGLKIEGAAYEPAEHPSFHPGKCARLLLAGHQAGVFGELHPLVREQYPLIESPVILGTFDLQMILEAAPLRYELEPVPAYPPVLEDLALVVAEELPADRLAEAIRRAGGDLVVDVRLFDLYRGEQIGPKKKSLAYSVVYQAPDRTLTDEEVASVRARIVREVEARFGAVLRA